MQKQIIEHLQLLEKEKGLKILLAVESGSRAWGFPSPDSDYDVRIIYIRNTDWYLSIGDRKDNMDYFLGKELDINGWDIRKTLGLLKKSNATPFEWAQSPVVYKEEQGFKGELLHMAELFFQPYHSINHYLGISKNTYLKNESSVEIKLKKLFYIIRPVFAINWILEYNTVPPMDIDNLMKVVKDDAVVQKIKSLIDVKSTANEDYIWPMDPLIKDYIDFQFKRFSNLTFPEKRNVPDAEVLNVFFRKLLQRYDT